MPKLSSLTSEGEQSSQKFIKILVKANKTSVVNPKEMFISFRQQSLTAIMFQACISQRDIQIFVYCLTKQFIDMVESIEKATEDEYQLELECMADSTPPQTMKHGRTWMNVSFLFQKKILWISFLLLAIVGVSTVVWISNHSTRKKDMENDEKLPQLRSYTSGDRFRERDDIGYMNVFLRKDADDRRRQPER
ncbi:unnamed protein product, partial [Adineta ricciae]